MTNEIENIDNSEDEMELTPAGKLVVVTTGVLIGVGAYFATSKLIKTLDARKAKKNQTEEQD